MFRLIIIISILLSFSGTSITYGSDGGVNNIISWVKSKVQEKSNSIRKNTSRLKDKVKIIKDKIVNWKGFHRDQRGNDTSSGDVTRNTLKESISSYHNSEEDFPGERLTSVDSSDLNRMRKEYLLLDRNGLTENGDLPMPLSDLNDVKLFTSKVEGGEVKYNVEKECYKLNLSVDNVLQKATGRLSHCLDPKDYKVITGQTIEQVRDREGPFWGVGSSSRFPLRVVCNDQTALGDGDIYLSKSDLDMKNFDGSASKVYGALLKKYSISSHPSSELQKVLSDNCFGCCYKNILKLCSSCMGEVESVEERVNINKQKAIEDFRKAKLARVRMLSERARIAKEKLLEKQKANVSYDKIAKVVTDNTKSWQACDGNCQKEISNQLRGVDGAQELYEKTLEREDLDSSQVLGKYSKYTRSLVEHIVAASSGDLEKMYEILNKHMVAGCYSDEAISSLQKRDAVKKIREKMGDLLFIYHNEMRSDYNVKWYYLKIRNDGCR